MLVADNNLYRLADFTPTPDTRLWAAVLQGGGVLSHQTAASRFGADLPANTIHVTVAHEKHPARSKATTVHRSRRLPVGHTFKDAGGLPLTTPPRTFVDLAARRSRVSDDQLQACLDAWIVGRQMSLAWLKWFLDTEAHDLTGRQRALELLKEFTSTEVESAAERALVKLLLRAGLGPFETQYPILRDGIVIARVDFAWPHKRVALEVDGYRFHSGPGVFVADRQRGNEIELAGWRLLRTTPAEIRDDPARLVVTVKTALDL